MPTNEVSWFETLDDRSDLIQSESNLNLADRSGFSHEGKA
jgi:hypothetical protein